MPYVHMQQVSFGDEGVQDAEGETEVEVEPESGDE